MELARSSLSLAVALIPAEEKAKNPIPRPTFKEPLLRMPNAMNDVSSAQDPY